MKNYSGTSAFEKEFRRLFKKYTSLKDDLERFKKVLSVAPTGIGKHFISIHTSQDFIIIKAHLACRYLRNNHSLRIIYAYFKKEDRIEFIELYFKGDKENEDYQRIKEYINNTHH